MNLKSILFLLAFCLSTFIGYSQIVSTEGFEATTYPPTGWSIQLPMTPQNVWLRQTAPTTNPTTTAHGGNAVSRFRARNFAAGTKQLLITRPIDYTNRGTSTANLDFWMFRDSLLIGNIDSLTIWVNSTDSINATAIKLGTIVRNRNINLPDTQTVNGWYHYTYSIPASFTGNTTRFIFEGTSETAIVNQGANIFIDDVSFDEFPALCTGTPNVGNIVNPTPIICGGSGSSVLSLSAPLIGFVGITYLWEEAASSVGPWTMIGTNSPTVNTGTISSTTFYRCTVNCSFSSLSYTTPIDSITVSSNIPPTVTVTPTNAAFCAGSIGAQLIAAGAVTYSWTPAGGLNTTTGDTVMASPTINTQYIVMGTDSLGCTDTAAVNVILNAGPNVIITPTPNDSVFCIGTEVILNSLPGGGAAGNIYLWSDGITTRRDTIIVTATTTYSVIVTNAVGCSNTDSFTVSAIPGPLANFGWTNSGNTYTFSDSSTTATIWTWTFGDGNGSSNQNPTYTYSAPGTYTVTLIISGTPCNTDDTITKVITIFPTGLNDISTNSLKYYPNPVNEYLNIELPNAQIAADVIIRNSVGQKVLTYSNSIQTNTISIPVNLLSSGMYFAEISINGNLIPFKFIKE